MLVEQNKQRERETSHGWWVCDLRQHNYFVTKVAVRVENKREVWKAAREREMTFCEKRGLN